MEQRIWSVPYGVDQMERTTKRIIWQLSSSRKVTKCSYWPGLTAKGKKCTSVCVFFLSHVPTLCSIGDVFIAVLFVTFRVSKRELSRGEGVLKIFIFTYLKSYTCVCVCDCVLGPYVLQLASFLSTTYWQWTHSVKKNFVSLTRGKRFSKK